eukprot:gene4101-2265_t
MEESVKSLCGDDIGGLILTESLLVVRGLKPTVELAGLKPQTRYYLYGCIEPKNAKHTHDYAGLDVVECVSFTTPKLPDSHRMLAESMAKSVSGNSLDRSAVMSSIRELDIVDSQGGSAPTPIVNVSLSTE